MKTNATPKAISATAAHTQYQHGRRLPTLVLLFLSLAALGFYLTACEEVQDSLNSLQYTCTNGTAASGYTVSSQTEKCTECNNGYYLTDADTCNQSGVYTCTGGTKKEGYTEDGNNIEFCIDCNESHYLTNNRCQPRGNFTCSHGTPRPGKAPDGTSEEHCVRCNTGYWLTNANRCQPRGVFTCQNGTQKPGNTPDGTNIEFCIDCNETHYSINNRCEPRGVFTCQHGTKKLGTTPDGNNIEFCTECSQHYSLANNRCEPDGVYICQHGTAKPGTTPDGTNIEFCTECSASHYLTNDRCEPRGVYTCQHGTQKPGPTSGGNDIEFCIECDENHHLTNNRCEPRGVYTCQNGTKKSGNTPDGTNIEFCTECNEGHYSTNNRCDPLGVFTCSGGTKKEGYTEDANDIEFCTECNESHHLTNNRCEPLGVYTCQNGTKKPGSTPNNNNIEFCTECNEGHYLTNNRCAPRGKYTCSHGNARTGYTQQGGSSEEHCVLCNTGYYLTNANRCEQRGIYICQNGTTKPGRPPNSNIIEFCTECNASHYLTNNRCELRGVYTCEHGTAKLGTTSDNNNIELCTECNQHHSLTNNRCEPDGVYTCQHGTAKPGETPDGTNIEFCTECINSTFSLINNQCQLPNTTFRPTIIEGVCNQSSGFVPTTYNDKGAPLNGTGVSVVGYASQYSFTNLTAIQQLECFKNAYTREQLPPKPTTTADHRNTLPSGMLYDHSKYELAFEDTFNQPDTSTEVSGDATYDYRKVLDSEKWIVNVGGRSPYPTKASAINKEHNWPVLIKDHKLYLGNPRVKATEAPHDYYGKECAYDEEREAYYIDGKWQKGSCECDETRADYCATFGVTAHLSDGNGELLRWRYGYLEVDVEQLFTGQHAWGCCDRSLGQIELRRFSEWISVVKAYWWDKDSRFSGNLPNFYHRVTAQQRELANFGVEFQLFEKYAWKNHNGASAWLVLHYNRINSSLHKGRFFQTLRYAKNDLGNKVKRKYGIEWTPKGYKIWYNDSAWYNGGRIQIYDQYDGSKHHYISHDGACHSGTRLDSDGFLQCGVSHAIQDFLIRTDSFSVPAQVENPYYIINSVRLWKPTNNYVDIAPVYR